MGNGETQKKLGGGSLYGSTMCYSSTANIDESGMKKDQTRQSCLVDANNIYLNLQIRAKI